MKRITAELMALALLVCACRSGFAQETLYAPVKNTLYAITDKFERVGDFPCLVNPRAFAALREGAQTYFVYWDSVRQKLVIADRKLKTIRELPLAGSSVWISDDVVLAVSKAWENGFTFTLYRLERLSALSAISAWQADLFVSDAILGRNGVLIAGGSRDDKANKVLWCAASEKPESILETGKNKDFVRLLKTDRGVYAYASSQTKTSKAMNLWYIGMKDNAYDEAELAVLVMPKDLQCWFGSGFYWQKQIFIPAWNGTEMLLTRLVGSGLNLEVNQTIKNIYGLYYPLGLRASSFWYIAYDYYVDPDRWLLSSYDGTRVKHQPVVTP